MAGLSRADVERAAARIAGHAVRTPLMRSGALDERTGGRVWLKAECLQLTGSFKFRGAYNRLAALGPEERRAGVVAFSSGNHAQGIARAARLLGVEAAIVMPADAPAMKRRRTEADGVRVVAYDRLTQSREAIAARLAAERGAVLVPSFDDPFIVAGQGTAGLEAAEELAGRGEAADLAVVPCGGGGLSSGVALAIPDAEIILVEPDGYDDMMRSLANGSIEPVRRPGPTLCDALQTLETCPLTFGILAARGARGVAVTDGEVCAAIAFAFAELKLVVEPGGAAALAALLAGKLDVRGRTVLVMLSGGNVDAATFAACLARVHG